MSDEFEREQMPGVGEVFLRRKVTSPRWIMVTMTAIPLGVGALASIGLMLGWLIPDLGAVSGWLMLGTLGTSLTLAGLFTLLNVTFASARIVVSEGEFQLKLGLSGPRIPVAEIASVKLVRTPSNRRGMGVRNDLRGTTTYQLWGGIENVHLEKADGKKLVIVIQDAAPIVDAIKKAMQRRDSPRVRVGELEESTSESDASAEQDSPAAPQTARME